MRILGIFLVFPLFYLAFSDDSLNSYLSLRPLILETPVNIENRVNKLDDETNLSCTSWRFAAETNNLAPWKTVPAECSDYVKDYVIGRAYVSDLEKVSAEAEVYASSVKLSGDGKDIWVFDVDETLLSNLPYYKEHGYGSNVFDREEFGKWVEKGIAPPITPSLKLYQKVKKLGYKVFLLTGRSERIRLATVKSLKNAGFQNWDKLIMKSTEDKEKTQMEYKSSKREEMVKEGYKIRGNSGDQWTDLLGSPMSQRSFKLPNPMYHIP